MADLSVTSQTFTGPVMTVINGNQSFNEFFSITFYMGGIAYFFGLFAQLLRRAGQSS